MRSIDLNCDLGESFGAFKIGQDEFVLEYITSANIACGYHAGDHNTMAKTVKMAAEKGIKVGAHPGYPDLIGFGRRFIETDPIDIYHLMVYQISALKGFCDINQVSLEHVKPHGALYNRAAVDPYTAEAIAKAVYDVDRNLVLYGLAGSELVKAGTSIGLKVANEVFADRTYQAGGTLTPRNEDLALIHNSNEACKQVIQMVQSGTVKAVDGSTIPIKADSVCIHGDGPEALKFAKDLREQLEQNGIKIAPFQ
ncbi:LamB/YcsF family protein [Halalkalibacter krulwichiae]|uniref:5-oxoprolinase subunit A n=1 Tax=Halalkalibacter krulwichiae TaxID=199441 RepID=A0A1X9MAI6_9BACI|nr:5-oxoprolinase subunit PxpA [Halalkalibacter krulwichiae]ARK28591.1 LamB/YcsF family protein [Halalkalibacter krulwichiae]